MKTLAKQRGASVSSVVFILIALGIILKLIVAIAPAQVGDYQLNKTIAQELNKANAAKETADKFMAALDHQMSINSSTLVVKDILTVTNENPGELTVHTKYSVENNFFLNVFIVSRFEKDITGKEDK